ncbi:helix-turn-helix domain-containing protein [Streptomyces aureus]|uniref:helix-turn-helix domain-containing protein n=1 Tax=Streptomyces aureus TaxID=193461 RepID=UPI0031CFF202
MSETRTLHAVPAPEPLTGLTGAPAAIYTALISNPGATATELALAAGIGRSTAGKALTALEEHGLAIREEGERTGARRTPDRWRCAQSEPTDTEMSDETINTTPNAPTATEPASPDETSNTNASPVPVDEPDSEAAAKASAPGVAPHAPDVNDHAETPDPDEAPTNVEPSKPATEQAARTSATMPVPVLAPRTRLAPGALRQRVIDHLQAHPEEAFTATRISRVIERSSGAIANALAILARQGIAEQISDTPRTFRLAPDAGIE